MTENDSPGRELAAVVDLIARLAFGFPTEEGGILFADRHDRGRAMGALVGLGPSAVEPLVAALHRGLGVGVGAAEALGLIGDERAVAALIKALADPEDSNLRCAAARALGRIGEREAAEPLLAALLDDDEDVRWVAANALGEVGYPDAVEALSAFVRREAEDWLWIAGREEDDFETLELLSNELARLAAYVLGRIGEPEGVAPLLEALRDFDVEVRWNAVQALAAIGLPEALPELERVAREDPGLAEGGRVSEAAREAVGKIRSRRRPTRPLVEEPSVPTLYKYLSPAGVAVLESRSLRFTPASRFNDPFELFTSLDAFVRPLLIALATEQSKTRRRSRALAVTMDENLGDRAHDLGLIRAIEEDFRRDDSGPVRAIREGVEYAVRSATKASPEARARAAAARRAFDERFGVLCLAERPDDILMWSHYADHHRGFVLELDAANAFFDRRRHEHDPIRRVRPVRYQTTRPSRGRFDPKYWLRSKRTAQKDLLDYAAGLLLLIKSQDWAQEREWRMILPLEETDEVRESRGETLHLLGFPPEALRAVILGCRTSAEDRAAIRRLLDRPDLAHVTLRRAEMHGQKFRLLVKDDESVVERALLEDLAAFPGDGIQQRLERMKVGGRRFYAAVSSLEAKGWILAPVHDPSKRGKRVLELTQAGRAALATSSESVRLDPRPRGSTPVGGGG